MPTTWRGHISDRGLLSGADWWLGCDGPGARPPVLQDRTNNRVRLLTTDGVATTLCGSSGTAFAPTEDGGRPEYHDGNYGASTTGQPFDCVVDVASRMVFGV